MNDILTQLGQLFVQTLPTVLLVFILLVALNRLLFSPVIRVMRQREEATSGALERARRLEIEAAAKSREYDVRFQAARQEVYRQREAERRTTLGEREERLKQAHQEAESLLVTAAADLHLQQESVKRDLAASTDSLAGRIAESVLGEAGHA